MMQFLHRYRHAILAMWLVLFCAVFYLYFFKQSLFETYLRDAFNRSFLLGTIVFLLLGAFRGLVFLPATMLIILGLLFYSQNTLFLLIMIGVFVSSTLTYWFARSLDIGHEIEEHNGTQVQFIRRWLARHEMPVVILWSAAPPLPTDVICYVCGALKMDYLKFIIGVGIGEAVCCATYIYFGEYIVRFLHI